MSHEIWVMKEFGFRYWVAYVLVRLAHRIKDTDHYQVIRTSNGSAIFIEADTWGHGVSSTLRVGWKFRDICDPEWPMLREFDDFDEALEWMYDEKETGEPKQERLAENSETVA
ncbi:hypothetical protein [Nocardia jiangxiensis]|uniref:hypothetical protein n=1 Tax=Nocardia jiangxiensis TaxID=282685 RepID=UPI0005929C96|nr:hypothetical protein [Nocardia jiangxiensis]